MTKTARILPKQTHVVAVVVFDDVVPFDFSTPCEVFERVRLENGLPGYDVKVCGVRHTIETGLFHLKPRFTLSSLQIADTIILPGVSDLSQEVSPALLQEVQKAAARGARIASVCTGAFILAATGLLDGARATTHWLAAPELARQYPAIEVDPNVLYVDNGKLLTSAGAAASIDLCLHMVRCDYGSTVAARVARLSVMPLEREGGQAQFIEHKLPSNQNGSLQFLLIWIEQNLSENLTTHALAKRACISVRTLHRQFIEQTGTTPSNWILHARVRRAQILLESTSHSIEWVAAASGFGSTSNFRERFRKISGTSPRAYRRSFRTIKRSA